MSRLGKRTRNALTGLVAVSALASSAVLLPQFASANLSTAQATTALNVRQDPNTSARILGVLSAGEQVERRGDPRGEWTPVRYRGQDAWVFSAYIAFGDLGAAPEGTATATTVVNVRSGSSTLSPVIGVLRVGEQVAVTGAAKGGWVPVGYWGRPGYVYAAYLKFNSSTVNPPVANPVEEPEADNEPAGTGGSEITGSGSARTALNVRSGPSTGDRVVGVLAVGERVDLRGEARDGWTPIFYWGQHGWVASQYLNTNAATPAEPETEEPSGGSGEASTAYTTSPLNLRTGPSTSHQVVRVLPINTQVSLTGLTQDGFAQVDDNGQLRWVSTDYLASEVTTTSKAYTTTAVNLRTGPSTNYRIIRVLSVNTEVSLTGVTQDGFSQVNDGGELRWISTTYLSDSPVSTSPGSVQGPNAPAPDGSHSLTFGGSSGLTQLRESTKQVVYAVRENYPQIHTMYGYRQDPLPDHPSGRAVDIMMPNGANDVALGDDIAAFLQRNANSLNIEYLIWRQRIWINGQSGWTWMADRGGITANHYDHIHVTVYN
ncbi:MAG: SH3 domain-containing protein [Brooklawnia sp.]|uniref:SH3 domain-containing protein n=1 Tax=Brooklawnia sp. TaxID=2699740 RepID=UPI003C742477